MGEGKGRKGGGRGEECIEENVGGTDSQRTHNTDSCIVEGCHLCHCAAMHHTVYLLVGPQSLGAFRLTRQKISKAGFEFSKMPSKVKIITKH